MKENVNLVRNLLHKFWDLVSTEAELGNVFLRKHTIQKFPKIQWED